MTTLKGPTLAQIYDRKRDNIFDSRVHLIVEHARDRDSTMDEDFKFSHVDVTGFIGCSCLICIENKKQQQHVQHQHNENQKIITTMVKTKRAPLPLGIDNSPYFLYLSSSNKWEYPGGDGSISYFAFHKYIEYRRNECNDDTASVELTYIDDITASSEDDFGI